MAGWPSTEVDVIGYAACALVLLTFSLRSLVALRGAAIASNLVFIAYASAAHLLPVLVLHVVLLPINLWRLWQCAAAHLGGRRRPCRRPSG